MTRRRSTPKDIIPTNGHEPKRLDVAVAEYLEETKLTKKPKTHVAHATALEYFIESCPKVYVQDSDRKDNTEIWGHHYSGKSVDIISLQQQIAGDIAEKLRSTLSNSEKRQVTKQGHKNP